MIKVKKQFIYIIAMVIVVVAVAIGTVAVLKISNNTAQTQTKVTPTIETVDALMKSAASTNDAAKAKAILLEARQQYVDIKDQDRVNAIDAMILMIDSPGKILITKK